jgi:hypothetical protein
MLRRLAAGMVVAVALSSVAFATGSVLVPAPVRALTACTGWTSEAIPPDTIRVLRTLGPDAGRVQIVPFRAYVETVMAAEFGPGSPREAMRAGAVAVKQFAWYKAMHWRGGSNSAGQCYDIADNGNDQWYLPLSKTPAESHIDAVAYTWPLSVRKGSRFISTGYWAGPDAPCGSVVNGYRLFQKSASRCARDGMTAEQILRVFYGPDLSVIRPGAHDMNGDGFGDIAVLFDGPSGSTVRLYAGDALATAETGATTTGSAWPNPIDAPATAPRGVGDVDGDGRADLVYVRSGSTGLPEVAVARFVAGGISSAAEADSPEQYRAAAAAGTVLEPPTAWWSAHDESATATATMPAALLVADFTGDGLADAAYVSTDPTTGLLSVELLVSDGASFESPVRWWSGARSSTLTAAVAGDFDGDGRMDIALVTGGPTAASTPDEAAQPAPAGVLSVDVLRGTRGETFDDPAPWGSLAFPAEAAPIIVGGDWDRDGCEDLMALWSNSPSGIQATALMSDGKKLRAAAFRSTTTGFNMGAARFATSDINGDGRTDIVALYDAGAGGGTRMIPFTSTGTRLAALRSTLDPTTPWAAVRPF